MISLIIIYIRRILAVFSRSKGLLKRGDRLNLKASIADGASPVSSKLSFESDSSSLIGAKEILQEKWLSGELIKESLRFVTNQRSAHTRRAYEGDLKQFIGYIRSENESGESFDLLLKYRDWLVEKKDKGGLGLKRGSANRKFATVRSFMVWLQSRGKIRENPSLWVRNFRAKVESSTQGFSDLEVARILEIPSLRTDSGRMHSLILHFLFYMGLRRSELVALKASNVERARLGDQMVLILRIAGKGDKERVLPIPEKVRERLSHYMAKKGLSIGEDVPLFSPVRNNITGVKTKAIDTTAVYYIVKKYAALAGVERRVSPHSCRATCISNALDHSASHRAVQELAGWSSPLMIERYDKRRTALQDSAVHVVDY